MALSLFTACRLVFVSFSFFFFLTVMCPEMLYVCMKERNRLVGLFPAHTNAARPSKTAFGVLGVSWESFQFQRTFMKHCMVV